MYIYFRLHLASFSSGRTRRMVASGYYVHDGRGLEVVLYHARGGLATGGDGGRKRSDQAGLLRKMGRS